MPLPQPLISIILILLLLLFGVLAIILYKKFVSIRKNKIKIALFCTSVNFFSNILIFLAYFIGVFLMEFSVVIGAIVFNLFLLILVPISLFGSLLFNLEMKKKSKYWFLGLPFSITILFYFILYFLLLVIALPLPDLLFKILLVTWAPLAILFFLSIPENQRRNVLIPVIICMIAGVIIVFQFEILGITNWGMSIIGLGLLVFAFTQKMDIPQNESVDE